MVTVQLDSQGIEWLNEDESAQVSATLLAVAVQVATDLGIAFGELRFLLVDTAHIVDLHARYFADPSPTDVITFPDHERQADGLIEGDVAICLDLARSQAAEASHSVARELAFLGTHGILHLGGLDDGTADQRGAMLTYQEELLRDYERTAGRL